MWRFPGTKYGSLRNPTLDESDFSRPACPRIPSPDDHHANAKENPPKHGILSRSSGGGMLLGRLKAS